MRATRITKEFATVISSIIGRSEAGNGTTIAQLLEWHGDQILRATIDNVLRAGMRHGLLDRTGGRPYVYRIKDDLPPDLQQFKLKVWAQGNEREEAEPVDDRFQHTLSLEFCSFEVKRSPDHRLLKSLSIILREDVREWLDRAMPGRWTFDLQAPGCIKFDNDEGARIFRNVADHYRGKRFP